MGQIDKRLAELGITLPVPAKPVANYVGWVRTGNLVYTAGQVSLKDGKIEVYSEPVDDRYAQKGEFKRGETIPLPGVIEVTVQVDEILP